MSKFEPKKWCADIGPEDGQDPRDFHRKHDDKPSNRKALQLCAQIREALIWILGTECEDEVLRSLDVVAVEPFPTTARVRIIITPAISADVIDVNVIEMHLHGAVGLLRSALARVIHRRKTPELTFQVLPMQQ